jgi:hypothetical protein
MRGAAKIAALSERRIARWGAFYAFFPAVEEAQPRGQVARSDPFGQYAFDTSMEAQDRAAGSRLTALRKPLRGKVMTRWMLYGL